MDFRILIFFAYVAFDGALARSTFSSDSNSQQSSGPVTSSTNSKLWPNGTIPYVIDSHFANNSRQMIEKAMDHIHENSCVRFVNRTNQNVYVKIELSNLCSSTIGRSNNPKIRLTTGGAKEMGLIQHELMHVMGFHHEHKRRDRDQYITVFKANVIPKEYGNYEKVAERDDETFGLPYDYQSVTHYTSRTFATSPHVLTMEAKDNKKRKLGQNKKLSPIDIQKINAMYPCNGKSPMPKKNNSTIENAHKTSIDDDNVNHLNETSI